MDFVALISGGKDSIYTLSILKDQGYTLKGLIYLESPKNIIDSYMYQSVGHEIIDQYSECLDVPLFKYKTNAISQNQDLKYQETLDDEVEDLYYAIDHVKQKLKFDYISSGAILSTYQKNRVENVCNRLGLKSLTPLWNNDQNILLNDMIKYGIDAMIVKIASPGFGKECIGLRLDQIKNKIESNRKIQEFLYKYFNFCGEGGEYESVVLCAPGFKKRILIEDYEAVRHPEEDEKEWNVFYMKINKYKLIDL